MTAKKRAAPKPLPSMPHSELPMMKALGEPSAQLRTLTLTIIDKIQVLALRRPRALIIVARVLDKVLDQQLEALLDSKPVDRRPTRTRDGVGRPRSDRRAGR